MQLSKTKVTQALERKISLNKFMRGLIYLALLLQTSLSNADIEDAHAYRSAKNYKAAYEEYSKAADNGNALAMLVLGHMYSNGNGVDKDFEQAFRWYKKSAEKGNAQAMAKVSYLSFLNCSGVGNGSKSEKKHSVPSLETYTKNKEMDLANDTTGYQSGYYAAKECDNRSAMKEWEKAANKGDVNSMFALASRYQTGVKDVGRDYGKAIKWFNKIKEKSVDLINTARVDVARRGRRGPPRRYKDNPATLDAMNHHSETETKKMILENLSNWSKGFFNSIFYVYKYTELSNYDDELEQRFKLHGQRIFKKVWIGVQFNLDNNGVVKSCEIIDKSPNLLDENIVNSNCFSFQKGKNNETLLDKVMSYFW
jgi:hypothetical protein